MNPPSPYADRRVALATRHGKERVIGRALRHGLGAELIHRQELDTDQLGSFCGTVARRGSPLEACLAKAALALDGADTDLAIASEGSFGPHPALPLLAVGLECMVFRDAGRNLTIGEELLAARTNFAHRWLEPSSLRAATANAGADLTALPEELQVWLQRVGFPRHGLIVRAGAAPGGGPGAAPGLLRKGIHSGEALLAALRQAAGLAADGASDGRVLLETDMRAHCNPTRMASIRQLSFQLMRRLRSSCPGCGAPGWGLERREAGLPCGWCRTPTSLSRAEIFGCRHCGLEQRRPRRDGLEQADPGQCPRCNP